MVGKKTLGELAAAQLQLPFYDIDWLSMERIHPKTPLEFFKPDFAQKLMNEKVKSIVELANKNETSIIDAGASLPCDSNWADNLQKRGTVIHITRNINSARATENEVGGVVVLRVNEEGDMDPGDPIHGNVVDMYQSDLPLLKRISDFTIENDGDISAGVEKLVVLIWSLENRLPRGSQYQ
jgi:shikimate kinase